MLCLYSNNVYWYLGITVRIGIMYGCYSGPRVLDVSCSIPLGCLIQESVSYAKT